MAASRPGELLARVNFPPYAVRMLSCRYLLVAGGGGKTKTGIANAIEIYELCFDGVKCCARPASRYLVGDSACMNCSSWRDGQHHGLAVGLDGDCQVYGLEYKIVHDDLENGTNTSRKREVEPSVANMRQRKSQTDQKPLLSPIDEDSKQSTTKQKRFGGMDYPDQNSNLVTSNIGFEFKSLQRFQTDFPKEKDDPYQKVVRISPDGKFIVTGGSDGRVRIWQASNQPETKFLLVLAHFFSDLLVFFLFLHKCPDFKMLVCIAAHNDDVDDIDIHPLGNKIVSVSRDLRAHVWSVKDGKKVCELKWDPGNDQKYRCRHCRFGICEGDRTKSKLFTAHVPLTKHKNSPVCYLIKWDTSSYCPEKVQSIGRDLSALALSDDGRFVAIGTMSGNIEIYIAFSLQRIYSAPMSHSNFVTGLEFLPSGAEEALPIVGSQDASLISISVDNQIKIHHIPKPTTISIGIFLFITAILLIGIFILMSYLEL